MQRTIGDWIVRTGEVDTGAIVTRVSYRGRVVRSRVSASALEAIETHGYQVRLVEQIVESACMEAA